jgi:uncharacterized membrane protein
MLDPLGCMASEIRSFGGAVGGFIIVILAVGVIAIAAVIVWTVYKGTKAAGAGMERRYSNVPV